jgi:hypothetical protein
MHHPLGTQDSTEEADDFLTMPYDASKSPDNSGLWLSGLLEGPLPPGGRARID